jgi:glycosyltransferase involved in cell wall biosynthesis
MAKKDILPRILVVGPLPPPVSGTGVSFQLFCNEVQRHTETHHLEIIDSSPKYLKEKNSIISLSNYRQTLRIYKQFCQKVTTVDQVLLFGSNGFVLLMVPILLTIAKIARKPCYVRVFGGSLDQFTDELRPMFRWLLLFTLRHADGLIVQTKRLYNHFLTLIGPSVYLVPGYRSMDFSKNGSPRPLTKAGDNLRLAFVGIVKAEKGIFVLLESLRQLTLSGNESINCDIFGLISESSATQFEAELAQTKNATYGGVLSPEMVVPKLRNYDALVLPTFYDGEGHPGVLIEAMMAGIPVITTKFRSIPELVEDRANGLLVAPGDAKSLAAAIKTIDKDRQLLVEMGKRNWERRTRYDARRVIPLILQPLGVNIQAPSTSLVEAYQ